MRLARRNEILRVELPAIDVRIPRVPRNDRRHPFPQHRRNDLGHDERLLPPQFVRVAELEAEDAEDGEAGDVPRGLRFQPCAIFTTTPRPSGNSGCSIERPSSPSAPSFASTRPPHALSTVESRRLKPPMRSGCVIIARSRSNRALLRDEIREELREIGHRHRHGRQSAAILRDRAGLPPGPRTPRMYWRYSWKNG